MFNNERYIVFTIICNLTIPVEIVSSIDHPGCKYKEIVRAKLNTDHFLSPKLILDHDIIEPVNRPNIYCSGINLV